MKEIVFIDMSLDAMGGVERIVNTLANNLVNDYKVKVISIYKTKDNPHFKYDDRVEYIHLYDKRNKIVNKFKKKNALNMFFQRCEQYKENMSIKAKIKSYSKSFDKNTIVVFGRVAATEIFLPYIADDVKVIVREAIHIKYTEYFTPKVYELMKHWFSLKVDKLIISSDENINDYKERFGNSINLVKIYNPLGIEPKPSPCNTKRVIALGRYNSQKGYENLVLAWSQVVKKHKDWVLRIVGVDESDECIKIKNTLEAIITKNKISKNIELARASKDVVRELCDSSIYVMPSRYEGYANALVEAMACGLPSITYDWLSGPSDIIENENNGLIVPLKDRYNYMITQDVEKEDVDKLSEAIIRLIDDSKLRQKFSEKAREIIETRDKDIIIEKWKDTILNWEDEK
jgi:Glycosyltransferase